jgi:hypothetical protein
MYLSGPLSKYSSSSCLIEVTTMHKKITCIHNAASCAVYFTFRISVTRFYRSEKPTWNEVIVTEWRYCKRCVKVRFNRLGVIMFWIPCNVSAYVTVSIFIVTSEVSHEITMRLQTSGLERNLCFHRYFQHCLPFNNVWENSRFLHLQKP